MKNQKTFARLTLCALALLMVVTVIVSSHLEPVTDAMSAIKKLDSVNIDLSKYYDNSVIYRLPDNVKDTDELSIIVQVTERCLLDAYAAADTDQSFSEFANSPAADEIRERIAAEKADILTALDAAALDYEVGADYDAVISGFEIVVKAADFEAVCKTMGDAGTPIVGEVYNAADAQLVENTVNVYETGIFNSSSFGYDGTGIVVAVLDTGIDYDHSAFSLSNFTADRQKLGLTFSEVAERLDKTFAKGYEEGLSASDVYINEKIPYAYDYADRDSDVFPLANEHGTHVAGIIAGKDNVITGVAPNAQLMIMKTFSDVKDTARSAWILSALNDCVTLGVDVVNMSLGTACGFSRETDKEAIDGVYDRVRDAGISLIVAASNSFSSTYGSEKNGNLGLTSNPDTATVGSPGTYAGALSIASINGAKTPYLLYNDRIIYFEESSDRVSEEKNFFDEILTNGANERELEYVTVPGVGRSADYMGLDIKGKIALVRRGATTFEEKAAVAQQMGALGMIVYNNVSGEIKMNVGEATIPVCSIRQDDGELMAATATGKIKIARSQTSGPFISDFSSWGPTPDLGIKPELTAHGGMILSAVPGQEYDRISGTSMACPNVAGLAALLRQYVMENYPDIASDAKEVAATVNRLFMSTADIVFNTNGQPYAVRKQGAGLANLDSAAATRAYILTYDRKDGSVMDKSKIELGDDPQKNGVYSLKFSIKNFGNASMSYDLSAHVLTEGVSDTKTNDGKTTVSEEAYALTGASVMISSIENGTKAGNTVTVAAGQTADITVTVRLSDSDKNYLNSSFENGMYVEGFIVLDAKSGTEIDLNVPYLAFYGDWSRAPMFDLDYYATNKDELDDSIDLLDKTLPDAYATRPVGGVEQDFINYLGSYYFEQDPAATKIAADRKYISISNQEGTVHSLRAVWAGLLRNAKRVEIAIVDDVTGEVVYTRVENDIRKSYGDGGSIYPANIEIKFDAMEHNLKNNTRYTVKLKGYLDYENDGADSNLSNTFEFPLVADFEAPTLTGCEFYTEYDKSAKKTRLFAKMAVYDNHYAMSALVGYVDETYQMHGFEQYLTPIFSEFNSTSYVVYELTDYIYELKQNAIKRQQAGVIDNNYTPSVTVSCYDYALNTATYEIPLPADFTDVYFEEEENGLTLNPNETYTLVPVGYPEGAWPELLEFNSNKASVARVVNNKIVAVGPGDAIISVRDPQTLEMFSTFKLHVRGEGEEGYVKYDKPVADSFYLSGYTVNKAYYYLSSAERDIGETGDARKFVGNNYVLSMFPSESVTLDYHLAAFFPNDTKVEFSSGNTSIVTVDEKGTITAVAEGFSSISVRVLLDGKSTYYSQTVSITVKEPYITQGPVLSHYFGLGGKVTFPPTLAITEIGDYAFSNYDYIPKTEDDEISEDEPDATKIWFLGDNTIEEVVIPEGVEVIGAYAFANLTALKSVTLPSTLKRIEQGAFYGCTALRTVNGVENVKIINQNAFNGCDLIGTLELKNAIAIANYAFANNKNLKSVILPASTKSVGAYAFANDTSLQSVTVKADKIKLGAYAFLGCKSLSEISVNASVIPAGAFYGCTKLKTVHLGADVAVIAELAFGRSGISRFTVDPANTALRVSSTGNYLTNAAGDTFLLLAPAFTGDFSLNDPKITSIGVGAFSGNTALSSVYLPYIKYVGDYAFADSVSLHNATLGSLEAIGDYAFYNTALRTLPTLTALDRIGKYAFAYTSITEVTIPSGMTVGEAAFMECFNLQSVTIGDNVTLEPAAFMRNNLAHVDTSEDNNSVKSYYKDGKRLYYIVYDSPIQSLTIGKNAVIGTNAFYGAAELTSIKLGEGAVIGDYAFYNNCSLTYIDLSRVKSIGDAAFSGDMLYEFMDAELSVFAIDDNNYYIYRYYAADLTSIDLGSADSIGKESFALCTELQSVTLGKNIKEIPDRAFQFCTSLSNVNLEGVEKIGSHAFYESSLTAPVLSSVQSIGSYAFAYIDTLTKVTFGQAEKLEIGEAAFSYCNNLKTVVGMQYATDLASYAFAYTALTSADLSGAVSLGTHVFLKEEMTDFTVTLGKSLQSMGDNPFAMCRIAPFTSTVTESFGGKEYKKETDSFDLNEYIRIINGSIYRVCPNGLVLITYTNPETAVILPDGVVRIGAMAFAGTDVVSAVLPNSLRAVGHKAFYGCQSLSLVAFTSYDAPILEEEYDEEYFSSLENIAAMGQYEVQHYYGHTLYFEGLAIVPYFMWNAAFEPTNVFYGANFVDYIGHTEGRVVMVKPVNGQCYDSFIMDQYFGTVLEGAAAADALTMAAIAAIDRLPEKITLADKPLVEAARAAYNLVTSLEQRALITNYLKLTQAENTIANLEFIKNQNTQPPTEEPTPTDKQPIFTPERICILLGVALAIAILAIAVLAVKGSKRTKPQSKSAAEPKARKQRKPEKKLDDLTQEELVAALWKLRQQKQKKSDDLSGRA